MHRPLALPYIAMPIKIDKNLPAYTVLKDNGVFVMSLDRAETQEIRPLRIGILNLMPKKEETEAQLFAMIGDTPLQVEPVLIKVSSYTPKNVSASHMEQFYVTFDQAKKDGLDGLIITGVPVEKLDFEQVAYWGRVTTNHGLGTRPHNVYIVFMLVSASGVVSPLRHK